MESPTNAKKKENLIADSDFIHLHFPFSNFSFAILFFIHRIAAGNVLLVS